MSSAHLLGLRAVMAAVAIAISGVCLAPPSARADTPAALAAIADTADRICGIVAAQGDAASSKVQGDIHAELNGLARRLATIGGSAAADITSSTYQGVLQSDLPATLTDVRKCKLQVFDKLSSTVLPGAAQNPEPGAPTAEMLRAPANVHTSDDFKSAINDFGLYACSNISNGVVCYLIMTRLAAGQQDFNIDAIMKADLVKLVDNFHIEHRLRKAYFIDGIGGHQQTTNLSKGESVWLSAEFESARPVSSARVVFAHFPGTPQLSGPVN